MASIFGFHDDILTCAVCCEPFIDPCTLSCQHTFCRRCIPAGSKAGSDVTRPHGLACPFCHVITAVSDTDKPVEQWVDQLQANPVIVKLMKAKSAKSDATQCGYCREEDDTVASAWCEDCQVALCAGCLRVHNKIPSCQHHDVSDSTNKPADTNQSRNSCQEHEGEIEQFYCQSCKTTLCLICVTSHDDCALVVTMEAELLAMRKCFAKRKEILVEKHKQAAVDLEHNMACLVETKNYLHVVESEIRSTASYAIEKIKEKETRLLNEAAAIQDKQSSHLHTEITSGKMAVMVLRQQLEIVSQTMAMDSVLEMVDLYEVVKCTQDEISALGIVDARGDDVLSGKFWLMQDRIKLSTTLETIQLGDIVRSVRVLDIDAEPILEDIIRTRVSGDLRTPWINDIIEILVGGTEVIVGTDFENKSVKVFYKEMGRHCQRILKTEGMPFCLTKLAGNQLAVTIPEVQEIIVVEVGCDDIVLKATIKCSKQYWGITALTPAMMAAGSLSPPGVDLVDMDGNVIRSLRPVSNNKHIVHSPNYLCMTSDGNILVSNGSTHPVVCMTTEGDVIYSYTPTDRVMVSPRGVSATAYGDVLVVDNYLHRVVRLSGSGRYVGHILTTRHSLKYPHGVCVTSSGRLMVSMYEHGIHVFTMVNT